MVMHTSFRGNSASSACAPLRSVAGSSAGAAASSLELEQLQDLGHFGVIELEDRGSAEGVFEDAACVERLAQVDIEDANALPAGRGEKGVDGLARDRLSLGEGSETDGICLRGKLPPLRRELEKVPGDRFVNDVLRLTGG